VVSPLTGPPGRRRRLRTLVLQLVALPLVLLVGGQGLVLGATASAQSLEDLRKREVEAAAALEGSTAAVAAAGAELARIAAALPEAERQVSVAQGELSGARAKASAARAEAERAELARVAAQGEVDEATAQVESSRADVARLGRRAYVRGRMGDVRDVMDAANPTDVIERGELLRSVFRSGTASLDRVTASRLQLAGKTAQLRAEEKAAADARAQADAQQARAEQVAAEAQAAVQRVAALVAEREVAVAAAEALREEDRRSYEQAQADSEALAERIRQAEAAAAARAAAERAAAERAAAERAAAERAAAQAAAEAAARAARSNRPAPAPAPARAAAPPAAPAAPPAAAAAPSRSSGWIWPGTGRLTSRYGNRVHPIFGDSRFHAGIDLGGGYGAPVLAARGGTVILSGPASGYGTLVVVSHGGGVTTAYAHMSALLVRVGDTVSQGQTIGRIGSEGNSTGPHLHFEVRVNGNPVDPLGYVSPP
jgi:murein DD-endopeptidase MepM/ murein hydrolase activator NlpD